MDLNALITFGAPALLIGNMVWRRLRGKAVHIPGMPRHDESPVAQPGAPDQGAAPLSARQWLDYVNAAPNTIPHLFVVGPTRAGKTTLARAIISERRGQCVIMTAKTKADWPGAPVVATRGGTAKDEAIAMFGELNTELNRRMTALDENRFAADELTIVLDDYAALRIDCGEPADQTVMRIARLGASLLMRLIVITDTTLVEAIGFKGLGEARNHFVSLYPTRQRTCTIGMQSETERDGNGRLKEVLAPIDARHVLSLSSRPIRPDQSWHPPRDRDVELCERLGIVPVRRGESGQSYQYAVPVRTVRPDTDAIDDEELIAELVRRGASANRIFEVVGGTRGDVLARVKELRGEG